MRANALARKLDGGATLTAEITVTFENVADMLRVLSAERVRLLHAARQRATPISHLASGLDRDIDLPTLMGLDSDDPRASARSAGSASPSIRSTTWPSCSTASTSPRCRCR